MIFLATILGFFVLLQLVLLLFVYKHRNHSTLKLHQPGSLMAYGVLAALATSSCILFIPLNNTTCILRDFFICTPITIMGNILVARSWRINTLMTPVLGIGHEEEKNSTNVKLRRRLKKLVLKFLTNIIETSNGKRNSNNKRKSFHQTVTVRKLWFLATILSAPQLVVQLCKLFTPSLQSELDLVTAVCQESSGGYIMRWVGGVLTAFPFLLLL